MRTWRITRRGASYSRYEELKNGRPSGVVYKGSRVISIDGKSVPNPNVVLVTYRTGDEVRLTEKGAQNLRHLGLVEVPIPTIGTRGAIVPRTVEQEFVVNPVEKPVLAKVESDETPTGVEEDVEGASTEDEDRVVVPDDWDDLPKSAMCSLASKIAGKRIRTMSAARSVIRNYLED